jgi:hypothetical protein
MRSVALASRISPFAIFRKRFYEISRVLISEYTMMNRRTQRGDEGSFAAFLSALGDLCG